MDDVPALFYENVCFFPVSGAIPVARQLSGLIGEVAADAFDNMAYHTLRMKNGKFRDNRYFRYFKAASGDRTKFEKIAKKHHLYTSVSVSANKWVYGTELEALEELLAATEGKRVYLLLRTSNISKELKNWIDSIQLCFSLQMEEARVPSIPESLIRKKTLYQVHFTGEEISFKATSQLLQLLKQDQFYAAGFICYALPFWTTLIADWDRNSSAMVGKALYYKEACTEQAVLDLGFRTCTEEEDRYLNVYYPRFRRWWNDANGLILRNESGARMYWFPRTTTLHDYTTLLLFA